MVSSVQPAAHSPLAPLQTQQRAAQQTNTENTSARDAVSISGAANLGAHDALANARKVVDLALGAGREGASILAQMRDLARAAIETSDADARAQLDGQFQALRAKYAETIDSAIKGGADLLNGSSLSVTLDSEGAPVTIAGYDLRLKDAPGAEDVLRLSRASSLLSDPLGVARDADASLARVDTALSRLSGASQRLSAHDQFLSALDGATAGLISEPADAEGARLLALQVRQGLLGSNAAITNSAPNALLTLFRE
jgi:flagellin